MHWNFHFTKPFIVDKSMCCFCLIMINLNHVEQQLCAVIINKQWLSITHTRIKTLRLSIRKIGGTISLPILLIDVATSSKKQKDDVTAKISGK